MLLVTAVLFGGWVAARRYGVLEQLGIWRSPSERLLSGTPNRQAAEEILAALDEAQIDAAGMTLYVLPVAGTDRSIAYAVLDAAEGFSFTLSRDEDPFIGLMEAMSTGRTAAEAKITRVAIDYRDASGDSLVLLTASTEILQRFRKGEIDQAAMLAAIDGRADLVSLYTDLYLETQR